MPRFKPYNYDQDAMVVINYHDQANPSPSNTLSII
jgi:hypothetical protein